MGDGLGKVMMVFNIFALVGVVSVLMGLLYGLFKLITWVF